MAEPAAGQRRQEQSRQAWLCGGLVGSKATPKSTLLPHRVNDTGGDRRTGQELLCHQLSPNPPLDVWDGLYCMRSRGPRPPCCFSFSGRKVKVRHQTLAAEDGVKTLRSRAGACLSGPTFQLRSQRQSMVQARETWGGMEEGRGFLGAGLVHGYNPWSHTGPHT